jgi:hypothetical protein
VNKKKQKNFDNFWPVALQRPWRRGPKVFWFFFQKRTPCFYLFFYFLDGLGVTKKEAKKTLFLFPRPPAEA